MTLGERKWWKDGVVYQVYPASYKDSNGDGVGDIPGLISTLDYLKDLGVGIVWLSPMYDSPQYDMGYDIRNYEDVYPPYGTLADMDALIKGCHDRGMKLILDLVINHTSHLHPWFLESSSSKTHPKRDWYIWRPPKIGKDGERKPPSNWKSFFGGSAWEWDEATQEYYLHLFAKEQPDLNWENDETRQAIYKSAMRFWLDKGIDGFRVDTVNMYSKHLDFADAPVVDPHSEWQVAHSLFCNGPRMHEFLREMNDILSEYGAMTVGELPHTPSADHVLRYISAKEKQLDMVFQFDILDIGQGAHKYDGRGGFHLSELKAVMAKWQKFIEGNDGWTTVFMENHDNGRAISRFCSDKPENRIQSGKMLALFLASLTGTLYIYQGQELGMINIPDTWEINDFKDIEALNCYKIEAERTNNDPEALEKIKEGILTFGRDNARTPMQWDDTEHAGFTTGTPWMRVHDLYPEMNVKTESADPNSVLNFWKRMLKMRQEQIDLFIHGVFHVYDIQNENTITYTKEFGDSVAFGALNFSDEVQPFEQQGKAVGKNMKLLVSTLDDAKGDDMTLQPYEGRIYLVL